MPDVDPASEDTARWESAYADGSFRDRWDSLGPAADLVGFIAAGTIPAGATVIDLGCGAGSNAIFLAAAGYRAVGVDLSPTALAIAAERASAAGVYVDWRQGSVLDLPVDTGSVAFAYDRGCLHHVAPADWPRYAAEVHRVLAPGGRLLLHGGRNAGEAATYAVDVPSVERAFAGSFHVGPTYQFTSHSDAGGMSANVVPLTRV